MYPMKKPLVLKHGQVMILFTTSMELASMDAFCLNTTAVSELGIVSEGKWVVVIGITILEDESEVASPINDPKKLTSDASSVESEQLTQTRVFSQFLADLNFDLASLGLNEKILAEVDNFCMKSREFIVEDGWADVLGKSLQKLLSDAFARVTLYLCGKKPQSAFLEDKRGMGSRGCDPIHQDEKDYQLSVMAEDLSDARKVSALPSLLISTVGSEMAVTGLITIRGVVVSQRLLNYTSLVGLVPTALPDNSPWVSPEDYHHACVCTYLSSPHPGH
ncbi:hypothetical protein DFH09DRAFT_1346996 [Mycena vulgaris]|nr:hypothetical protein DFH09DRAFT_1346996 [Mycena vulgaris]